MPEVGFSTGCLRSAGLSREKAMGEFYRAGATAVELNFGNAQELISFDISNKFISAVRKFPFAALHAPTGISTFKGKIGSTDIIQKLREFCSKIEIRGIVLHPSKVEDFDFIGSSGLPFLIENMDKDKDFGRFPDEFNRFRKSRPFGFVLDVQHAYENDPSMQVAGRLLNVFRDRLRHYHISGETEGERHCLLHKSRNREAIGNFLRKAPAAPIIFEGAVSGESIQEELKEEIAHLKSLISG